jgi:short-subunit dehydrogenase
MKNTEMIFVITGAAAGFGRAFAEAALEAGHTVVGTVRREDDRIRFEALHHNRAKAVIIDLAQFDAIDPTIQQLEASVGPIDVLINNAGYGHEGVLEESPLVELVRQFEVNVFAAVAMIKAVLPSMRRRRRGHIINITSMAGYVGMPGISYYSGSKFALEGITETLAQEVKNLGVKVTAIAPGSFRTEWAGRSMVRSGRSISDYDTVFDPVRKRRQEYSGHQAGDPAKAAQVLLDIVQSVDPPTHLLLGRDAVKLVKERLAALDEQIKAWEPISCSTDYT